MGKIYDNWERLVEAVMRREQLRSLSLADSRSPSIRSLDSDYSFSSCSRQDDSSFSTTLSPLHTDAVKLKLTQISEVKEGRNESGREKVIAKTRTAVWKSLSIFNGRFSSKKNNEREKRELQRAKAQRTLHGLETTKHNDEVVSQTTEMMEKRAEFARLTELRTLKGHIESLAKARGVDLDSVHHYYTV